MFISPFKSPQFSARKNPCIILFLPVKNSCYKEIEEQYHSLRFYPNHGTDFLLGFPILVDTNKYSIYIYISFYDIIPLQH